MNKINQELVDKINCIFDKGIIYGLGNPKPGEMCVEQAVCYALGEEVTDKPSCVGKQVRDFVIYLNDSNWSSKSARAEGMRELAIAQLGSTSLDQEEFLEQISFAVITKLLPAIFRDLGEERWEKEIKSLEKAKDFEEAKKAASASAFYEVVCFADDTDDAYIAVAVDSAICSAIYYDDAIPMAAAYVTKTGDKYLKMVAHLAVEVLKDMKSPGCYFLS